MPAAEYHEEYRFLGKSKRLTHPEILAIAGAATRLGVSKLRLTGGEPLLDKGLPFKVGGDLGGTDETVLSEQFDRPVCVTHYPAAIKAFYMKPDPDEPDDAPDPDDVPDPEEKDPDGPE